ncbi:phosphoribosylaminoimidazolesuccinocarboxamide synthase [Amycolatopsis sp. NPDC051071]|uniref:phosphoribosylaminoimidazolesuccinocarboxamide synthase n=1 Tax=Amycolatopsis sp. NPDC051071 TaxID=3154637 RepID=UPI003417D6D9
MTTLEYPKIAAGKVRELYAVDDEHLLLVTSDRISAYDVIFTTPIPDKGRVLTAMSVFWFSQLSDVLPNHLVSYDDERIPAEVRGRALLVRRLAMLPVEAVARGYLTGTGLVDYRARGTVCGVELPDGLTESSRLPEPIFTPATKADHGSHDENIAFSDVVGQLGRKRAEELREATLAVYRRGAEFAAERGILLADTKLEFGVDPEGNLVLADEVLTPDSSRYWQADGYTAGSPQPSFDKQPLRDWLTGPASGWHRMERPKPPPLPDEIVAATRARYIEAYERITGRSLDDWPS